MKEELKNTLDVLKSQGLILYPTDTVWGIGCDATDAKIVAKVFTVKQRDESKSLVILVDSFAMLQRYVPAIPNVILDFLKTVKKPTTIIYNNPMGLAQNIIASDNTVAIRIVKKGFCHELIKLFDKPIVSTSANISDAPTPLSFKEIDASILDVVDYVVNLQQKKINNVPSAIIRVKTDGTLEVIRA